MSETNDKPEAPKPPPNPDELKDIIKSLMTRVPEVCEMLKVQALAEQKTALCMAAMLTVVLLGIIGVAVLAGKSGNYEVAEHIVIPLISFLGGIAAARKVGGN